MKKVISLILAIVMVALSMVCANAYSAEEKSISAALDIFKSEDIVGKTSLNTVETEEPAEDVPAEDDPTEDVPEDTEDPTEPEEPVEEKTLTEKWFEEFLTKEEIGLEIQQYGLPTVRFYVKGDKVAIESYSNGRVSEKILYADRKYTTCSMQFPYYYYSVDLSVDITSELTLSLVSDIFDVASFVDSYEYSGYVVEKFISSTYGEMSFFFKDGELEKIDIPSTSEVVNIVYEVNDDVFELPFLAIDITPLYNLYIAYISFILNIYMGIIYSIMF